MSCASYMEGNEVYVYVWVYKCCYKILIPSLLQHIPCKADLQPPLIFKLRQTQSCIPFKNPTLGQK